MSDSKKTSETNMPHISVNAQYIKDLSFENPGAPQSLAKMSKAPEIDLSLDLNVAKLQDENMFEVELSIEATAKTEGDKLFLIELKYAGVFHLLNVEKENVQPILGIHCPSMLFPFARNIVAETTQNGGFQPLMIDPLDFGALYHKKMSEQKTANDKE